VTIRFGTYTVQANTANLDRKTKTLRAEGDVSIADGFDNPPRKVSCVLLDLSQTGPLPKQCKE
jgi:hypothetical protein